MPVGHKKNKMKMSFLEFMLLIAAAAVQGAFLSFNRDRINL